MTCTEVSEGVVLLNPKAEPEIEQASLAPRLPTIKGATVALVNAFRDPDRTHGDLADRHLGELLLRRGVGRIVNVRKDDPGNEMPVEKLEHIASQSEAAIFLMGD